MAERDAFNDEEWSELCSLPLVVATLISAVDYSAQSEGREFNAFVDFLRQVGGRRKRAPIVDAVLKDAAPIDQAAFRDQCTMIATARSGEKPIEAALKRIKQSGALLADRLEPKQASAFRDFIMELGGAVARAHKESMLPFANPVSHTEDFHLRRISKALGV
ncbi:MAG: hypothetical protein O2944_04340 [Proteobacteria bacterium]|nr:hypothetical protein [Pseudomonadota bacterium]